MGATIIIFLTLYVGAFVVFIFSLFFADVDSEGYHGFLSRMLLLTIPDYTYRSIKLCFGASAANKLKQTYEYVVRQRNPLLVIAYFTIINSAFITWIIYGIPFLPNQFVPYYHVYVSYSWAIACQVCFIAASYTSPGRIKAENIEKFSHQPFDGVLYASGLYCKTCLVPKVILE